MELKEIDDDISAFNERRAPKICGRTCEVETIRH